jgi:hypothetical protein
MKHDNNNVGLLTSKRPLQHGGGNMSYVHRPRHQPDAHPPMWQILKLYLGTVRPLGTRLWPESGIKPADLYARDNSERVQERRMQSDGSFVWMRVDVDYVGPGTL